MLLDLSDGITIWVSFEHRAFHDLLDAEGCSAEDLIGRRATAPAGTSLVIHGNWTVIYKRA